MVIKLTARSHNQTIAGLIVTYNHEIHRFNRVLYSALSQCHKVVIVDNYSFNYLEILRCVALTGERHNVTVIRNTKNLGLAAALNVGKTFVLKEFSPDYVLFLDQDTVPSFRYVSTLLDELAVAGNFMKIGVINALSRECKLNNFLSKLVSLVFLDLLTIRKNLSSHLVEPTFVIISGSIIRADLLATVSFREGFFLDWVDYDFCIRARKAGYSIVLLKKVLLSHSLGTTKHFGRLEVLYEPSFRYYLIVRNARILFEEGKISFFRLLYSAIRWFFPLSLGEGLISALITFMRGFSLKQFPGSTLPLAKD
jgi:rhamnosyltransferase